MSKRAGSLRDELITKARYGKITPEEAEAQAKTAGLPPFASQPEFTEFDPMKESRWTLVMAIAWIAWRDPQLVMEQGAEFRTRSTLWQFREWNEPVQNGQAFATRAGWFLETWHEATAVRLTFIEAWMRANEELPSSARLTPREAEKELWRALAEEKLGAEGFDSSGHLVDIPAREWIHLKLFEDGKKDVLRYDALDRREPYTKVRFRREDIVRLWPRYVTIDPEDLDLGPIEDVHFEPMSTAASHVPLSAAVCWIITRGGVEAASARDQQAWKTAVGELLPRISDGTIEIIGRDQDGVSSPLPPSAFASIRVPSPVNLSVEYILADAPIHIRCHFLGDEEAWEATYNDQFFTAKASQPRWTHLQVRRQHVLRLWPKPDSKSRSEVSCRRWLAELMRESPERPKPKADFLKEAKRKFRPMSNRQFYKAWDSAIEETQAFGWKVAGRPRRKSNHPAN
jgi:hypothetical protein